MHGARWCKTLVVSAAIGLVGACGGLPDLAVGCPEGTPCGPTPVAFSDAGLATSASTPVAAVPRQVPRPVIGAAQEQPPPGEDPLGGAPNPPPLGDSPRPTLQQ
jgi:hypothetical protein